MMDAHIVEMRTGDPHFIFFVIISPFCLFNCYVFGGKNEKEKKKKIQFNDYCWMS